jgi:Family of unknown function (DUF6444)
MIAAQAKAIEELTAADARPVERVTALERHAGRNSGNSSMPPSCDDLPGRKKPPPRQAKVPGASEASSPARRVVPCRGWRSLMSRWHTVRAVTGRVGRT